MPALTEQRRIGESRQQHGWVGEQEHHQEQRPHGVPGLAQRDPHVRGVRTGAHDAEHTKCQRPVSNEDARGRQPPGHTA
ncbi:hypothetical protein ACFPRL_34160 [Pseudoclavibacter helvolus]